MSTTKTFVGIADCYGLESLIELGTPGFPLGYFGLRADANKHRLAVAFLARVFVSDAAEIEQQLDAGQLLDALRSLQMKAASIKVSSEGVSLWNSIPDASADPYPEEEMRKAAARDEDFAAPLLLETADGLYPIDGFRRLRLAELELSGQENFAGYILTEENVSKEPSDRYKHEMQSSV